MDYKFTKIAAFLGLILGLTHPSNNFVGAGAVGFAFPWTLMFALVGFGIDFLKQKFSDRPNPDTHVKCPDCRELVLKDALKCKHCGCKLIPQ